MPDATRPVDLERTVRPLISGLSEVGAKVTMKVALGLHRPMTPAELAPLSTIADTFETALTQHDPELDDFASELYEADAIVCVGVVEPHQYAGFSGGAKTVAIGCAPRKHIAHMHRVDLLRDPRVTLGSFADNPFQQALWQAVAQLPPLWGLYHVPTDEPDGGPTFFGPARVAMEQAVDASRRLHFEQMEPVPWLHLVVPSTKASNVYQASRAATYAGLVEPSAVQPGGLLIVDAPIPEGLGNGAGEVACGQAMMRGRDALLSELDSEETIRNQGGSQRAYVIANTLRRYDIAFVGGTCGVLPQLQAMGIPQFAKAQDALSHFGAPSDGRVITQPFHRVPIANAHQSTR